MKKMYLGIFILALLLGASVYNVQYLDKKMNRLLAYVDTAGELAERDDFDGACALLREAISCWEGMDSYTNIFIRHSEVDSAYDAFYDSLGCMQAGGGDYPASLEKLRAHLRGIVEIEHLSLGSIF